jgi:hypothetical protein
LPRAITCADNDQVVMICLLFGTAHPALGADDDLQYLVDRLRREWPDIEIHLRADSGFATPTMYQTCERLGIWFTIGLGMNPVLKRSSEELLEQTVENFEKTGEKQRVFCAFWYQARSWSHARYTIVKCEAHTQGTNRRAIVTNRPGAPILPGTTYDEYVQRGESENRNKELKCGLHADRLSDHRYMANLFRLYLHSAAHNLLVRLRHAVAKPPPENHKEIPTEALAGNQRRCYFNNRRQVDPLGEGHPATWQTRLIKVAAEIVTSSRRILVRLSSSWPYRNHYRDVSDIVLSLSGNVLLRPG